MVEETSWELEAIAYGPVGTSKVGRVKIKIAPNLITKINNNLKLKNNKNFILEIEK